MSLNRSPKLLEVTVRYARDLRKRPTRSERLLWAELRARKLGGWRFQRQRPILIELDGIGTFAVADFYCAAAKLIVEVDGTVHEVHKEEDQARDEALAKRGYSVMRVSASDVEHHIERVLVFIEAEVRRVVSVRGEANYSPFSCSKRRGMIGGKDPMVTTHLDETTMHHALITCILVTVMIAGCSSDRPGTTELVFWAFGAEGEHVAKLIPEFERRHPEIHVRVQMIPWNAAHEKLLTAFAGQSLPDMCQLGNTWIPEFAVLNALEPLAPWVAQSGTIRDTSFFPGIWDTNLIDSVLYGIPWYVDTRVLFYRKDLFEQVGFAAPPRSWEEWFELSARLKAKYPDDYALLLPVNNEFAPSVILGLQQGSTLLKENNTRGNFSGKEFVEAMHAFHRFFVNGWAPAKPTQIVNLYQSFAEGYFAMYITGPWNIGEFKRRLPDSLQDAWMTAPLPGPSGDIGVSLAGGSSLVMFRSSEHKHGSVEVD